MSTRTQKYNFIKPDLTDPADITATNSNWDLIDEKLSEAMPTMTYDQWLEWKESADYDPTMIVAITDDYNVDSTETVALTLFSNNWSGESMPYIYDLTSEYPDNKFDLEAKTDIEALTTEQLEALMSFNITGGTSNKLYALGEKPNFDISVVLKVTTR